MGLVGEAHAEGRGVSVMPSGEFDGELQLGSSTYRVVEGSPNIFVALLEGDIGGVKWLRRFGSAGREVCRGIDPGQECEIIISGEYNAYFNLDVVTLKAHGPEDKDIFIARLREIDGAVPAPRILGSKGEDADCELEPGEDNAIWCSGNATSGVDYPGKHRGTSGNQFLLRFTPDLATVEQAMSFSGHDGTSLNFEIGLVSGNRGLVVGSLSLSGTADVDSEKVTAQEGEGDFFVARFGLQYGDQRGVRAR